MTFLLDVVHAVRGWTTLRFVLSLSILVICMIALYTALRLLARRREQLRFMREHNCQSYGPSFSNKSYLLGADYLLENGRNIVNRVFAEGIRSQFDRLGPTYTSRIALKAIVSTIDPLNLEAVFKTHFRDYQIIPARIKLIGRLLGKGAFATDGQEWDVSRHLTSAGLASMHVDTPLLEKHFAEVLHILRNGKEHGAARTDFGQLALQYTWNISCDAMFGNVCVDDGPDDDAAPTKRAAFAADFALVANMARWLTIFNNQMPWLADVAFWRTFRPTRRRLFAYVEEHAIAALAQRSSSSSSKTGEKKKPETLIEGLASRTSDVHRIRSETLNLLLGGSDGAKTGLCELFYLLARHPAVWEKLKAEVASLGGRHPSPAELRGLQYTNWCINEATRLRPSLSVHGRLSIRDTVLPKGGGTDGEDALFVPRGTYLVYSNYALHRNPAIYGAQVDDFVPERWASISPGQYEYLQFGVGPRRCPGRVVGLTMMAYATVRLAQEIESLSPAEDRPWQEMTAFAFSNLHGHHIYMTPRAE